MTTPDVFERVIQAIIYGDEAQLKTLLQTYPGIVHARYETSPGRPTLLHFVAANGVEDRYQRTPDNAIAIAEMLFDHGADPNVMSELYGGSAGSTPLVGLVSSAHPHEKGLQAALTEVFIKHGAKVDGVMDDGMPLATTLAFWYPDTARTLLRLGARVDNLVFAAAAGDLAAVRDWWSAPYTLTSPARYPEPFGRKVTETEEIGLAFAKACLCDQLAVVRYFVEAGLPIDIQTPGGRTGLHEAAYRGSLDTVQALMDSGADASIRDVQFNSLPVHWAKAGGQQAIFDYLLPKSPLRLADLAEFGMYEAVVETLSEHPDRVNGEDGSGLPLREAANANELEIVRLLLTQGADRTLTNKDGRDALYYARRHGHRAIIDLLEADPGGKEARSI